MVSFPLQITPIRSLDFGVSLFLDHESEVGRSRHS